MLKQLWEEYLEVKISRTTWSLVRKIKWPQRVWVLVPFIFPLSLIILLFLPEGLTLNRLWGNLVLFFLAGLSLLSLRVAVKLIEAEKRYEDTFADDKYHRSERYGRFASRVSKRNADADVIERAIGICDTQRALIRADSFDARDLVNRSYAVLTFILSFVIAILGVIVTYMDSFLSHLSQQPANVLQSYVPSAETAASAAGVVVLVLILYFVLAEFFVAITSSFRTKREELLEFKLFLEMYLLENHQSRQPPRRYTSRDEATVEK